MIFKFVLTGTYSSFNKGDAAMQMTTATLLERQYTGCEVTISAPFPDNDREYYAPRCVIKCNRRNLVYSAVQLFCAKTWKHTRCSLLLFDQEMRSYRDADLIVDLSGDMLTEDYGFHVALSHYFPILLAKAMGKKVALCAQSVGPFKWTSKIAFYILNHAGFVSLRDQVSMDYLQSTGIKPRRLKHTADMAFLLEPVAADISRSKFAGLMRGKTAGPVLGVSLSFLIESHFNRKNPIASRESFWPLIAGVLDDWIDKYRGNVLFFAHVTGPGLQKDDREASKQVIAKMRNSAALVDEDLPSQEIKGLIRHCDQFIGARMHANIAALSSFVPTIALSYSHKTPGIMNQLGCGEYVIPIEAFSSNLAASLFLRLTQEHDSVRSRLHQCIPKIQELSRTNLELIDWLLQPDSDRESNKCEAS